MIRILTLASTVFLMSHLSYAQARDPIGEKAFYGIDTNRQRTSMMISSGNFLVKVLQETPDATEPAYNIQLNYTFKVLGDTHTGNEVISVTKNYFDPQFMIDLRGTKHHETAKFKIQHLGFKNATTIYRGNYPNCDYLRFYDIDTSTANPLTTWFSQIASSAFGEQVRGEEIEDLEIFVHVKESIPTLGAVKLDAKGKYKGMNIKVGADYKPEQF